MSINIQSTLGEYLFLAMGECNGHKVVMGIGYTHEYADKKAKQFESSSGGVVKYIDISVIKTGDKEKCKTLEKLK
ncbi:hypothetical protein [Chryseobacterium sp. KCF3-3]|uniref:hypothetical protein n=1 Tax=Chryseobacterium sp. KCF3-3 TaxID=3231511 RepID=UPI0038B3889F